MSDKTIENIKAVIALVIFLCGIIGAVYIGGWVMFIKPIIAMAVAIDAQTITATLVAKSIIKIIFAGGVGSIIFTITTSISKALLS